MIVLYMIMTNGLNQDYHVPISGITWAQYLNACGVDAFNKDRIKSFRNFDFYYSGKGVEWTGYVVMVESMNDDD